jgi:hypothetical protein
MGSVFTETFRNKKTKSFGAGEPLNGQLPLDRAAYTTKQAVIGALVRTALARHRKAKQRSEE